MRSMALVFSIGLIAACEDEGGRAAEGPPLEDARFLIEHNSTDEDTGFQVFADGEPWNRLEMVGPDGKRHLLVTGLETLSTRGLTELFFETGEPPNAEVPIGELLAGFPEGEYEFIARSVEDGSTMRGTASLSHAVPAGPVILSPPEDAVIDPDAPLVVSWQPVTASITGSPVEVVGYELIVEVAAELHPAGFSKPTLDVHLPAAVTSLRLPREFLQPATAYELEVLALEVSGNQTLTSSAFETE